MKNSNIEWCSHTFNPWTQCTPVSAGCANCYASALNKRFTGDAYKKGVPRKRTGEANWKKPLAWNREAQESRSRPRVFCASLADVFDAEAPDEWRYDLFDLIEQTPNLDWLLLTKRPENIMPFLEQAYEHHSGSPCEINEAGWAFNGQPPANVWLGTSVENQATADERIPHLLNVPAKVRFLSCEPLLGPVDLRDWLPTGSRLAIAGQRIASQTIHGSSKREVAIGGEFGISEPPAKINWVIAGGESGPNARPMHPDWARLLRDQCEAAGVAYFFKQWGEFHSKGQISAHKVGIPLKVLDNQAKNTHDFGDGKTALRIGKKAAGRLLDGVEHNEFPEVAR